MSNKLKIVFGVLLATLSFVSLAEQKFVKGNWDIHYIAFPATFIEPEVAKTYQLIRSKYKGIVNISVLDNKHKMKAQNSCVSGTAKNLLGQSQKLNFKKVEEGEAIYYLAVLPFRDQETYRFTIRIQRGNDSQTLKFQQKMYVD